MNCYPSAGLSAGEDLLASWLLAPASADEVAARHDAVRELAPMLDLREDLAVLGATVRSGLDPHTAATWGEAPEVVFPTGTRYIAPLFAAAVVILFALYMAGILTRTPVLTALLLEIGYAVFVLGAQTERVTHTVDSPSHDLLLLSILLERLEKETFRAPRLQQLHARLKAGSQHAASFQIARLGRLVERLDWQENKIFALIAFAAAVERPGRHGN